MTRSRQTADWGSRAGLAKVVPSSITVGSGTGSASTLGTVTFTTVSSVSLNGVFSSAYANYRIVLKVKNTSSTFVHTNLRFRANGSDASSGNYQGRTIVWGNDGGSSGESRVNDTSMLVVWNQGTKNSLITMDIGDPNLTEYTNMIGTVMNGYIGNDTNQITSLTGGMLQTTTSYDGFTLYPASSTFSGTLQVYGYN